MGCEAEIYHGWLNISGENRLKNNFRNVFFEGGVYTVKDLFYSESNVKQIYCETDQNICFIMNFVKLLWAAAF